MRKGRSRASGRASRAPRAKKARPRSRSRGVGRSAAFGVLALCVLGGIAALGLAFWSRLGPTAEGRARSFHVDPARSLDQVIGDLAQQGILRDEQLFRLYVATMGRGVSPVGGEHLLSDALSPRELLQRLGRSPGRPRVRITIPEGFEHVRLAQRLADGGVCSRLGFVRAVRDPQILQRLGIGGRNAEGYLFPATYEFFVDSDPARIVERLVEETRARLQKVAAALGPSTMRDVEELRGWGESEILTLASMIEKEAVTNDERPLVASVFYNRLDDATFRPLRMLQSDPTAAYGCLVADPPLPSCGAGGFTAPPAVTPRMLRDPSNPYNTYQHPGLPPGPIANPGESALRAALAPAPTSFLFFVAAGGGRHRFSRTFQEHRDAIRTAP